MAEVELEETNEKIHVLSEINKQLKKPEKASSISININNQDKHKFNLQDSTNNVQGHIGDRMYDDITRL